VSTGKFLDPEMLLFLHTYERTEKNYRALLEKTGFKLMPVVPTQSRHSVIDSVGCERLTANVIIDPADDSGPALEIGLIRRMPGFLSSGAA
jgi:hypothetical protein